MTYELLKTFCFALGVVCVAAIVVIEMFDE
jgi:hypothetical protein